jgi:methylthioribulose-1-phosphate dehydratase
VRISDDQILITSSGINKGALLEEDIVMVNLQGKEVKNLGLKPSAETLLHCTIYRVISKANAVLHTHSVFSTLLSSTTKDKIVFQDYEMLKALRDVSTHKHKEIVPIFPNDQDMKKLSSSAETYLSKKPESHAFLIHGHGLYTWGQDFSEAKRHAEAFEFLLECEYRKRSLQL